MGRIFFLNIKKFIQFARFTLIFQVDGAANRHQYYYWLSQRPYILSRIHHFVKKLKLFGKISMY